MWVTYLTASRECRTVATVCRQIQSGVQGGDEIALSMVRVANVDQVVPGSKMMETEIDIPCKL